MKPAESRPTRTELKRASISELAAECLRRCDEISRLTETEGEITRRFLSPPIRQTHDYLRRCMSSIGMSTRVDDAGNLIGRRAGDKSDKTLLIGSHLDTVPNGGKYDGLLGVLIGLSVLEVIWDASVPFDIEVIGFSEEEGVRFSKPYLGSHAIAGSFELDWLDRVDDQGSSMRSVIESFGLRPENIPAAAYDPDRVLGFVEPHIEQGPLLHRVNRSVGAVEAIAGQSRLTVRFRGEPGHAGTVPMTPRKDALVAASRWALAVCEYGRSIAGLRATVGCAEVWPNVRNVIPARVDMSLDVRHADDRVRSDAVAELSRLGNDLSKPDDVEFEIIETQSQAAVVLDEDLDQLLRASMASCGIGSFGMFSGAGHDAAVMAKMFPSTMLFIRQPNGISHHPDEDVNGDDVAVAIEVLVEFVQRLAAKLA